MLSPWRRRRRGRRCPRATSRRRNAAIRKSLTPPRSERCPAGSGLRASPSSPAPPPSSRSLSSSSSGRPSSAQVKAAMLAAGCTYRDVTPLPPKKDPHDTIGGYHADVPSLSTPTKGLWSTSPPSGGAHYPLLGGLGLLHLRRQPPAGRPQRGARRRDHLVGPEGPAVDDRELRPSTTSSPDGMFGTPVREPRQQDRTHRLDREPGRPTTSRRSLRDRATSRSARASTRTRSPPSATPTAARAPRGSRSSDDEPGHGPDAVAPAPERGARGLPRSAPLGPSVVRLSRSPCPGTARASGCRLPLVPFWREMPTVTVWPGFSPASAVPSWFDEVVSAVPLTA